MDISCLIILTLFAVLAYLTYVILSYGNNNSLLKDSARYKNDVIFNSTDDNRKLAALLAIRKLFEDK